MLSAFPDENGQKYGYMILRSKSWLYTVTVRSLAIVFKTKRSDLWLCDSTVENLAIRSNGRKFGYRFQDEYGRIFGYTFRDENGEYDGENDG